MLKTIRTLVAAGWHRLPWGRRAGQPTAEADGCERSSKNAQVVDERDPRSRVQASSRSRVVDLSEYEAPIGVL